MMIHFIRPYWLAALLPAMLYAVWIIYAGRQNNPWKRVCDPHLLSALVQPGTRNSHLISNITLLIFFIMTIFALAGPSWKKSSLPIYQEINSLMLALDLSSAMKEADLKPDRLTRAKLQIRDLIHAAQKTQMGLVAFTSEAFVASPLSKDANTLNGMIDELDPEMMPLTGSDISQGLTQGLALLKQAAASHSNILLITASEPTNESWAAAKEIAHTGNHLNILAMLETGPATQSTIDKLQALAKAGDGSFYLFTPNGDYMQNFLSSHDAKQIIKDDKTENATLWQDAGPWFCLLLIPFALLVLRERSQHEKNH